MKRLLDLIRRWWRGPNIPLRAPHERWPEILHWKAGDNFDLPFGCRHTQCDLVSLCEDGYAAVRFIDEKWWEPISRLVGRNKSLQTRRVNAELMRDGDYMRLIEEFQKAYRELEQRDRQNGIAA